MTSEKLKKSWIAKSQKQLEKALLTKEDTLFDVMLFGERIGFFVCKLPIAFPDHEDDCLRTLRATRLKMFGYFYDSKRKVWLTEKNQYVNWGLLNRVTHL